MDKYFNINKNKLNKLQINEIGKYSISKPKDAKTLTLNCNKIRIIDGTLNLLKKGKKE